MCTNYPARAAVAETLRLCLTGYTRIDWRTFNNPFDRAYSVRLLPSEGEGEWEILIMCFFKPPPPPNRLVS